MVALAGWLVPGAGYWLIGQRARATAVCAGVLGLFVLGVLVAGVRVIDVPGWERRDGSPVRVHPQGGFRINPDDPNYARAPWVLRSGGIVKEVLNKPWYVGQVFAGPVNLLASWGSIAAARAGAPASHARIAEIGTLYTAVAGMLNLIAMIDASHRAARGGR